MGHLKLGGSYQIWRDLFLRTGEIMAVLKEKGLRPAVKEECIVLVITVRQDLTWVEGPGIELTCEGFGFYG